MIVATNNRKLTISNLKDVANFITNMETNDEISQKAFERGAFANAMRYFAIARQYEALAVLYAAETCSDEWVAASDAHDTYCNLYNTWSRV